jgi:hypothetical protein
MITKKTKINSRSNPNLSSGKNQNLKIHPMITYHQDLLSMNKRPSTDWSEAESKSKSNKWPSIKDCLTMTRWSIRWESKSMKKLSSNTMNPAWSLVRIKLNLNSIKANSTSVKVSLSSTKAKQNWISHKFTTNPFRAIKKIWIVTTDVQHKWTNCKASTIFPSKINKT